MEEDTVVKKLVDMVVVDVRIVAGDLMALKIWLLVVGAVVWLIEEGHGRGCGHGCGLEHKCGRVSSVDRQQLVDAFEDGDDYHELAALLGILY